MVSPYYFTAAAIWALNGGPFSWLQLVFAAGIIYAACTSVSIEDLQQESNQKYKLHSVGTTTWPILDQLARFRSLVTFRSTLAEAYDKYLRQGLACKVPDFVFGPLVVLPASKLKWILSQPSDLLHPTEAQHDLVKMKYLLWFTHVPFEQPMHGLFPRKWMSRLFEASKDVLYEEIGMGFEKSWGGTEKSWKEVNLYRSTLPVVAQSAWEALVGSPLCRDTRLWHYGQQMVNLNFPTAQLMRCFPSFMDPLTGPIFGLPLRYVSYRLSSILIPHIQERTARLSKAATGARPQSRPKLPNDYMSWLIQQEIDRGTVGKHTPHRISCLLINLYFAASQSTTNTVSDTIRCLIDAQDSPEYLTQLREEIEQVSLEEQGHWTKAGLSKLTFLGSAIRETMRLYPALSTAPVRTLCRDVTLEEDNLRLRKGTKVSIAAYSLHTDAEVFSDPYEFDPYRFARPRHQDPSEASTDRGIVKFEDEVKESNVSLLTLTDTWMGWGAGKSACPGRYLAHDIMKLMLVHVLQNYDMRPITRNGVSTGKDQHQGTSHCFGPLLLPVLSSKIQVRRRSDC
ncbi:MAG: hypothetical protein M1828_000744 [Chrysothrix sp. TS-e1954]|nr:MAG: hypothetical protein M1828_000744 [Chrysothrix sp. TS-e1954]